MTDSDALPGCRADHSNVTAVGQRIWTLKVPKYPSRYKTNDVEIVRAKVKRRRRLLCSKTDSSVLTRRW